MPAQINAGIEAPRVAAITVIQRTAEAAENAKALRPADHRKRNQCRVSEPGDWLVSPGPGCDDHGAFQPDDEKVETNRHRGGFPGLAPGDNVHAVGEVVKAQIEQHQKDGPEANRRCVAAEQSRLGCPPDLATGGLLVLVELRLDYQW
jgi:hypothetical protein